MFSIPTIYIMILCVVVAEWSKAQVSGQRDASDPVPIL